jgi:large subunit ribosomal protein L29
MKAAELRQMETAELLNALEDKREELFKLRLNWSAGALENPNQIKIVRHDIARMLTVLRERELAAELVQQEEEEKDA